MNEVVIGVEELLRVSLFEPGPAYNSNRDDPKDKKQENEAK
jgi:hypothetical protein